MNFPLHKVLINVYRKLAITYKFVRRVTVNRHIQELQQTIALWKQKIMTGLHGLPSWIVIAMYFTRMYSYVTRMLLVCTCMLLVCCLYVTRMYSYVTRMYSYVTRMYSYVTRMYSYVTRMYSYVTRMYSYVTRMY